MGYILTMNNTTTHMNDDEMNDLSRMDASDVMDDSYDLWAEARREEEMAQRDAQLSDQQEELICDPHADDDDQYGTTRASDEREDQFRSDAEADADVLAGAGYGTDEDYGYFGGDEGW